MSADDPDQLRAQIDALLSGLPHPVDGVADADDIDFDQVASCLEAAHDVLVQALESVERG